MEDDRGADRSIWNRPTRRERLYGVSEIAELLGEARGTVHAWQRRGTHDMPPPDQLVGNMAVWFADTIEPWIERQQARKGALEEAPLSEAVVRELAMRSFRLMALLLEPRGRRRPGLIRRAARELGELGARLGPALDAYPARGKRLVGLLRVLAGLPQLRDLPGEFGSPHPVRLDERWEGRLDELRAVLLGPTRELMRTLSEVEMGAWRTPRLWSTD